MAICENCGHDPDTPLCPDCGYLPAGENGSPDATRERCWTCEFPNESKQGISVGNYVMRGGQYCDGEKRIMALPGNHPEAHPESKADAERIMKKHGIDCDTGFWTDDVKKEKAMKVAKQRKPEQKREKSPRTH